MMATGASASKKCAFLTTETFWIAACFGCISSSIVLWRRWNSAKDEIEKLKRIRNVEREGRTKAEQRLNEVYNERAACEGFAFQAVGILRSPFKERRGTPRQSGVVPLTRGKIKLEAWICKTSLDSLNQFSHIWLTFVFHKNTNLGKKKPKTFPGKIKPPRLGGKKVGIFSTRTPHRPNPVGLTLAKIENINSSCIEVSGIDMIDGTPILDIKPYLPMDRPSTYSAPDWIENSSSGMLQEVIILPGVEAQIKASLLSQEDPKKATFYSTYEEYIEALTQVLGQDIRSVHQGKGSAMMSPPDSLPRPTTSNGVEDTVYMPQAQEEEGDGGSYECAFDGTRVRFRAVRGGRAAEVFEVVALAAPPPPSRQRHGEGDLKKGNPERGGVFSPHPH